MRNPKRRRMIRGTKIRKPKANPLRMLAGIIKIPGKPKKVRVQTITLTGRKGTNGKRKRNP